MTVQGDASPVADVDLDAAAEQMAEIYGLYWERLRLFIWKRLDLWQEHLSEDLASETFAELWRRYFLAGRTVDKPYGLLCSMAVTQVARYFQRRGNLERALDFNDPVNTPIVATGHAYAANTPDLSGLAGALDAAMERMTKASTVWRELHKESHRYRKALSPDYRAGTGGVTQTRKEQQRQQLADAERRQSDALTAFQETCHHVGVLRAELEASAGPNWKSAAGMPASVAMSYTREGSLSADVSVTHCPSGHELTLTNTHFYENGTRRCRACMDDTAKRCQAKARATAGAAR
ncbi:hypothetical protein OIA45_49105 (plasmid) [Streptomyces chartreusis]|uniref:hypothetical protein n=1 Tax=Streptomyces chartreusis TaxID=1969 RepID=UPI0037DD051E|nr:hypothetical protein OIA45_49105 [Streptomyces chartreusis]